jgi:hypothetical protein
VWSTDVEFDDLPEISETWRRSIGVTHASSRLAYTSSVHEKRRGTLPSVFASIARHGIGFASAMNAPSFDGRNYI